MTQRTQSLKIQFYWVLLFSENFQELSVFFAAARSVHYRSHILPSILWPSSLSSFLSLCEVALLGVKWSLCSPPTKTKKRLNIPHKLLSEREKNNYQSYDFQFFNSGILSNRKAHAFFSFHSERGSSGFLFCQRVNANRICLCAGPCSGCQPGDEWVALHTRQGVVRWEAPGHPSCPPGEVCQPAAWQHAHQGLSLAVGGGVGAGGLAYRCCCHSKGTGSPGWHSCHKQILMTLSWGK